MKDKRIIVPVVITVILLAALAFFKSSQGLRVAVLKLEHRSISKTFREIGETVPAKEHHIYCLQGGSVTRIEVEEGDQVEKGDMLAAVDDTELIFQLRQLQAQLESLRGERAQTEQSKPAEIKSQEYLLERAKIELASATEGLERAKTLRDEGAMTPVDFDYLQNAVDIAAIDVQLQEQALSSLYETQDLTGGQEQFFSGRAEALQAQIDQIKYHIERCSITAPAGGVVANLSLDPGEVISFGSRIMSILQGDDYLVETFVPVEKVRELEPGQRAKIFKYDGNVDHICHGTIEKIAPSAQERTSALGLVERRIKVVLLPTFSRETKWYPGTSVDIEFTTDVRENVLVVPKTAVFPYGTGEALWLVKDGKASICPVEIEFENDLEVAITGIDPGDSIIVNPNIPGLSEGKNIILETENGA